MQPPHARTLLLELLDGPLTRAGEAPRDELDLIEAGVLDSIAFLELLSALQERAGITLDLLQTDPAELTTLGALLHLLRTSPR
ncbi:hypothetical protein DL240_15590 [Lujinxingia litoralis]|uniref:Carrier domain-containing protein n=1 Tax=Lujinxingia litoralis TaxID=2211119 RepID=A0A328C467_9DELT|nr:phosphopantetheine-binding protein [Lujinxingia litoralis]RAL20739.1 hypothetical protein DL240_15590 [Lujinxingia litoralis]